MKDEAKVEEKVEEVPDKKADETPTEKVGDKSEKPVEAPVEEEKAEEVEETPPVVNQTEQEGNGIRVEDLVTKADLTEKLDALVAKMDALIEENKSLKDKYENKDFGGMQRKSGVPNEDNVVDEDFDTYWNSKNG